MASVFISFVHEDEKIASAIRYLIQEELEPKDAVFLSSDFQQVRPGELWLDKVRAALESCEVLLSLLSARAIRRPWINFEAGAAWIRKRPVIPVCFGKMSAAALPQPYSGMQAVTLPRQKDELLKAVAGYLGTYWSPPLEFGDPDLVSRLTGQPAKRTSLWHKMLPALIEEHSDE